MGRLFCLIGKSGSGKDTIFRNLIEDKDLGLLPVVTYTTRPKRDNETNGKEYFFVDKEDIERFRAEGRIIELREYNTVKGIWQYSTVDDGRIDFKKGSFLMIATLEAFEELKKRFGDKAVPLYIEVEDGERLERALCRERSQHKPEYAEMCRRFLADSTDFSDSLLSKSGIERRFINDDELRCVSEIKKYIHAFNE